MFARIALCAALLPAVLFAQQPELPRFRAGTNLVRVDAYVSKDDVAVEDLEAEDFVVYEDDKLQNVESFQLIKARPPIPQSERRNPTNVRDMQQEMGEAARRHILQVCNGPARAADLVEVWQGLTERRRLAHDARGVAKDAA